MEVVNTGERPPKGTYTCLECHEKIQVIEGDILTICPNCKNTTFVKDEE